jgi:hypothetical protein
MEGLQQINQMMIELRENPLKEINGERVIMVEDYQSSIAKNLLDGSESEMTFRNQTYLFIILKMDQNMC